MATFARRNCEFGAVDAQSQARVDGGGTGRRRTVVVVDQGQCFLLMLLVGAVIGFWRGWVREVITCAVILGAVLFLIAGGENLLAHLLFVALPNALHSGAASATDKGVPRSAVAGLSAFVLTAMTVVGFMLGNHFGSNPSQHTHRWSGVIPGVVSSSALAYYLSRSLFAGTQVALHSPTDSNARSYLQLIYGAGLIGIVLILSLALFIKTKR